MLPLESPYCYYFHDFRRRFRPFVYSMFLVTLFQNDALLDFEVLSFDFEIYCVLERDAVYSSKYGVRESSCVNRLCRPAVKLDYAV